MKTRFFLEKTKKPANIYIYTRISFLIRLRSSYLESAKNLLCRMYSLEDILFQIDTSFP